MADSVLKISADPNGDEATANARAARAWATRIDDTVDVSGLEAEADAMFAAKGASLKLLNKERKVDKPMQLFKFPSNAGDTTGTAETIMFHFLDLVESDGSFTNFSRYLVDGNDASGSSRSIAAVGANQTTIENVAKVGSGAGEVLSSVLGGAANLAPDGGIIQKGIEKVNSVSTGTLNNMLVKGNFKQTGETIQLMMPPKIEFNTSAGWQAINSRPTGLGILAEIALGDNTLSARAAHEVGKMVMSALYEDGGGVASSYRGQITNPYTSQAFEGMNRRSFRFDWVLAPKNNDELSHIRAIINMFRFHAHPTLTANKDFLKYPSQVDVIFKTLAEDNHWLPKIATCVIKDVNVDYTPNGQWSALNSSVPGAPSMFNLSITVEEIVPLVKSDIEEGF